MHPHRWFSRFGALAVACAAVGIDGCSSSDSGSAAPPPKTCATNPGGTLADFASPCDPGPGGILFTASGEVLALGGYAFPPASPDDPAFVDGWEVHFDEVLVTLDHIRLSEGADTAPGDPSQTGAAVAQVDGPWAVDLHAGGPIAGKGGSDEQAVPIAAVTGQNLKGNVAFDTSTRYAFGFDVIAATKTAHNVNLSTTAQTDYAEMIAKGYGVFYVGTATFKGTGCTPDDPEFAKLPKTVNFRFGFASPTTYVNCQNPDNDPAQAFPGEEHERGLYAYANKSSIAQVTIHTDHPFWESVVHDSPAHFDPIAARGVGKGDPYAVTLEDMHGVNFLNFTDAAGAALPWRTCQPGTYTPPASGTMHFDPRSVPVDPSDSSGNKLRDYYDYMVYNQSTQGHLNSDGLCFVHRNYPAPP